MFVLVSDDDRLCQCCVVSYQDDNIDLMVVTADVKMVSMMLSLHRNESLLQDYTAAVMKQIC